VLVGGGLAGAAWWGWSLGYTELALVAAALAWGQLLHLIGDIVTVSGVPLFWPLSSMAVCVLPKGVAAYGELLIGGVALIFGYWVLATGGL
jgi:membrane-bound metal-dependent hydrolase YbcI (DUF457 family)